MDERMRLLNRRASELQEREAEMRRRDAEEAQHKAEELAQKETQEAAEGNTPHMEQNKIDLVLRSKRLQMRESARLSSNAQAAQGERKKKLQQRKSVRLSHLEAEAEK